VQHASLLTTSLYLLPSLITGVAINIAVGMVVHRVPAMQLVVGSALICALSPLIMALVNPAWSYWYLIFWAQAFSPFSADVLFTVGLIVVSDSFPEKMQGLAGAVFNTAAQFGMTFGIGVCQVVALGVMGPGGKAGHGAEGAFEDQDPAMLLKGYRASFWTMFAYMLVIAVVAVFGLRKAGKIGVKTD
jgi:MFS family permease